jgi:hypothetical protein
MSCCFLWVEPCSGGKGPSVAKFQSGQLAPADLKKDAGAFDLPIALGLLVATGQVLPEQLRDFAIMGELALDRQSSSNLRRLQLLRGYCAPYAYNDKGAF